MTPLLKPDDVAACLGVSKKAVDTLCRAGKPSYVRVNGKERRFLEEHIQEYIEAQTVKSRSPIDKKARKPLPCPPKGEKVEGGADLGKEIRELCQ